MLILFFAIQIAIVVADQLIKLWIETNLAPVGFMEFIPGFMNLSYVQNRGIAFGFLQDSAPFMSVITGIVLAAMIIAVVKMKVKNKIVLISFAMIIGGGIGNLIDRVFRGYVVDYLNTSFMNFPTFNLADCMVCIGVGVALICLFVYDTEEQFITGKKRDETV